MRRKSTMTTLIGLSGKLGTGKSTVALYLRQQHGFVEKSFAAPLKEAAAVCFGLTPAQMLNDDLKEVEVPYWGLTPRDIFQRFGTESMRNVFGHDFWVRRMFSDFDGNSRVVISDVRFENEAKAIRDRGGIVIHIKGPSRRASVTAGHVSESGIEYHSGDFILLNESTLDSMAHKVNQIVESEVKGS